MQHCDNSNTATQAPPTSNTGVLNPSPPVTALIDWLSFTAPAGTPVECLLPLAPPVPWVDLPHGALGYRLGKRAGHISVYWAGTVPGMGVHVVISGQGCRELEAWGLTSWVEFLGSIVSFGWSVTRLDYAIDDRAGLLDMDTVLETLKAGDYTSPSKSWNLMLSGHRPGEIDGRSCYVGSTKSDTRIRIYDKAQEQSTEDGKPWVRVELQLRSDRANQAARQYVEAGENADEMMHGLLLRQLDFKVADASDSHKSRRATTAWWAAFMGEVRKVRLQMDPITRTLESVQGWLNKQVAPSIALIVAAAGGDFAGVVELAREGRTRWGASHRNMLAWSAAAPVWAGAAAQSPGWY